MTGHLTAQPLIVGAGPTGLAAALFLADRGVRSRVIDRGDGPSTTSRAQVVNPRSLDLLEPSGVTASILAEGRSLLGVRFYEDWRPLAHLDFKSLTSRFAMTVLPQARTEALLSEALAKRGIVPERGVTFEALDPTPDEVRVTLRSPGGEERSSAPLLLGADGAHSRVRDAAGIAFDGTGFPEPWPLYDIELDDPLDLDQAHVSFFEGGLIFLLAIRPGLWRVFGNLPDLLSLLPPNTVAGRVAWESSFHIGDKLSARAAQGRVMLAGDAAHIHSPVGARGMNLGIEDAYVFAACAAGALAGEAKRIADYDRVRHDVHAKVVARMDRLTTLARGRPAWMRLARHYLIPALMEFGPLARGTRQFIAGVEQPTALG